MSIIIIGCVFSILREHLQNKQEIMVEGRSKPIGVFSENYAREVLFITFAGNLLFSSKDLHSQTLLKK